LSQYKGLPYHDSRYQGGAQKIPGRVLCAYYDLGGEGVAYHDSDPQNHGGGELVTSWHHAVFSALKSEERVE
jgi:hypothetical protein